MTRPARGRTDYFTADDSIRVGRLERQKIGTFSWFKPPEKVIGMTITELMLGMFPSDPDLWRKEFTDTRGNLLTFEEFRAVLVYCTVHDRSTIKEPQQATRKPRRNRRTLHDRSFHLDLE